MEGDNSGKKAYLMWIFFLLVPIICLLVAGANSAANTKNSDNAASSQNIAVSASPGPAATASPGLAPSSDPQIIDRAPANQNEFTYNGVTYNFYTVTYIRLHENGIPCTITKNTNGSITKLTFKNSHFILAHGLSVFDEDPSITKSVWNTLIWYEGTRNGQKVTTIFLDKDGNGVSDDADADIRIDVTTKSGLVMEISMSKLKKTSRTASGSHFSSSAKSSGGAYPENDYDVDQYKDPEDFYYDHEDEFEDYEDAEDYFDEYYD